MPQARKRRIVKRTLLAVAGTILLLASYIGWWCLHNWGRAYVIPTAGSRDFSRLEWLFSPLNAYAQADLPGSDALCTIDIWAWRGGRSSWGDCRRAMRIEKGAAIKNQRFR